MLFMVRLLFVCGRRQGRSIAAVAAVDANRRCVPTCVQMVTGRQLHFEACMAHTQVLSSLKWATIEILDVTEAEQVCKHDYVRQVLQSLGHQDRQP